MHSFIFIIQIYKIDGESWKAVSQDEVFSARVRVQRKEKLLSVYILWNLKYFAISWNAISIFVNQENVLIFWTH